MALPDFVIIGAMKCGTTTLASQLGAQPGIFMSTPKEPNFFSDDEVYAQGVGWYRRLFDPAPAGTLRGEASTHYTKLPTYPETTTRLSETLEEPKLIYLIRDPMARAVSHYIHEWTQGVISSDLETALDTHPEIISYGCYGMQIAPWVEIYGSDRILVSSMEAMQQDPQALMDRIGAFLGRDGFTWQADMGPENVSSERVRKMPMQRLLIDNPLATFLRRTLVPQGLRDRIKESRQMKTRPKLSPAAETRLARIFAEDRDRLMAMFPDQPDLALSYGKLPR
jgi:hypothetical protein